jgi:UDP-3-O-[3-hydroxymyristoyl] N-acetylglucosamine deacetylase / 3-hydroxyacyl-[acyl-carrier-protein] dehydratase
VEKQRTIASEVSVSGIGLHSGKKVSATFRPAPVDAGVVFFRKDLEARPALKASVENVKPKSASMRYSYIENEGVQVATIEHLLAALSGMAIDNLYVEIDAAELPGGDGSSLEFVKALEKAGIREQEAGRKPFVIREPVYIEENGAYIVGLPAPESRISYTLKYNNPVIGSDFIEFSPSPEAFGKELAGARTFCLEEEAEELKKRGLGMGATYDNTLVVGPHGVIKNSLRFPNEFARHKMLDLLGDLAVLGQPIVGRIIAAKSGHSLNLKFVRKLAQQRQQNAGVPAGELKVFSQTLDVVQIMQLIPHRQPFLLVDRILQMEPCKRCVGIKNVTMNENFFEGHFPGKPVMPGVLIIEAMAQVGGVMMLALDENKGKMAYFMAIDNAKFRRMVVPGDQIVFEVTAQKVKSRTGVLHGTATVDGKLAAESDLMFALGE